MASEIAFPSPLCKTADFGEAEAHGVSRMKEKYLTLLSLLNVEKKEKFGKLKDITSAPFFANIPSYDRTTLFPFFCSFESVISPGLCGLLRRFFFSFLSFFSFIFHFIHLRTPTRQPRESSIRFVLDVIRNYAAVFKRCSLSR